MHAHQQSATLRIEGEMTIYRAAELKQALLAALAGAQALEIDLSGVTEIDGAGVQVLMLAMRVAQQERCALMLVGHSAAVREVFALLDFAGAGAALFADAS